MALWYAFNDRSFWLKLLIIIARCIVTLQRESWFKIYTTVGWRLKDYVSPLPTEQRVATDLYSYTRRLKTNF